MMSEPEQCAACGWVGEIKRWSWPDCAACKYEAAAIDLEKQAEERRAKAQQVRKARQVTKGGHAK
jgi:hypothetical protein